MRPSRAVETEGNGHEELDDCIDGGNPSAVYAVTTASSGATEVLALELSERSTASMPVLWKLFNNPTFRGGVLARSLFCQAAKEKDTQVLPTPWTGGTSLKTTIAEKRAQEQQWLGWTENDVVNEWVRRRVFSIVIANPRPQLVVTWKGRSTQMAVHGAASIVVTESHRCRIAHLAVDTKAKMLINLIYGSKSERSDIEDNELRVAQLWTEVANDFVNAQSWTPFADMSLGTSTSLYSDIDVTACPADPGLDAATIKEIWMELRTDWSRLNVAIHSKTGASVMATGSMYENVWNHFICGQKMTFSHKTTAMYCFELWDATNRFAGLPQWCNRTLPLTAGMSAGVGGSPLSLNSTTPKSKPSSQAKEGKEPPPIDSSARLCSLLETFMQQQSTVSSKGAKKFDEIGAELRALQTAQALIPQTDPMRSQIDDRVRVIVTQMLQPAASPVSPS